MTSTATATFELEKWEPQAQDEAGGTEFARVAIAKTFTGAVGARVGSCCGTRRVTRTCRC